jgi:hypothetical protein
MTKARISALAAAVLIALVSSAFAFVTSANAATFTLVISADIDMIPAGTLLPPDGPKVVDVPPEFQGRPCDITTANGESVHTGASATFETPGQPPLTLNNIEESPGATQTGQLVLGATLSGRISSGLDPTAGDPESPYFPNFGGYSGGAVVVSCPDVVTTPPEPGGTSTIATPSALIASPRFTG